MEKTHVDELYWAQVEGASQALRAIDGLLAGRRPNQIKTDLRQQRDITTGEIAAIDAIIEMAVMSYDKFKRDGLL